MPSLAQSVHGWITNEFDLKQGRSGKVGGSRVVKQALRFDESGADLLVLPPATRKELSVSTAKRGSSSEYMWQRKAWVREGGGAR